MSWSELLKAKKNLRNIESHLNSLSKNHSSLTKKELAHQEEIVLAEIDEVTNMIEKELDELRGNIESHRKYMESKTRFVKRHYSRRPGDFLNPNERKFMRNKRI